jgi:hypothetical protein
VIIHIFPDNSATSYSFLKALSNDSNLQKTNSFYICGTFEQINKTAPTLLSFKNATFIDTSIFNSKKKQKNIFLNKLKSAHSIILYGMLSLPEELVHIFCQTKGLLSKSVWVVDDSDFSSKAAAQTKPPADKKARKNYNQLILMRRHIALVICTQYYHIGSLKMRFGRVKNVNFIPKPLSLTLSLAIQDIKDSPIIEDSLTETPVFLRGSSVPFKPYIWKFVHDAGLSPLFIQTDRLPLSASLANELILTKYDFNYEFMTGSLLTNLPSLKRTGLAIFDSSNLNIATTLMILLFLGKPIVLTKQSMFFGILRKFGYIVKPTEFLESITMKELKTPFVRDPDVLEAWLEVHLNFYKTCSVWQKFTNDLTKLSNLSNFSKIYGPYLTKFIKENA